MAKEPLKSIFQKTETAPAEAHGANPIEGIDRTEGAIRPSGVGVRDGEIQALKALGAALGVQLDTQPVAVNALMVFAIQRFLDDIESGRITLADLAKEWETPSKPKAVRRRRG